MTVKSSKPNKKIILFDGVCNLCSSAVTFIISRDKKGIFHFASLQSKQGIELLNKFNIDPKKTDSLVLVTHNDAFVKSTAALQIAKELDGIWSLFSIFLIIPRSIRDAVYDFIARNRFKWFGKKESCMIPTPKLRARFLDQN
ncbi:MAG: thiol-disulfide oxidoreductase DCC family protein [Leeuwenhoekiella sp.]